jgi:hypothetical protein
MYFSTLYASSLALPVLVAGHGGIPGAPRIFGLPAGSDLELRQLLESVPNIQRRVPVEPHHQLVARQRQAEQTCGPNIGSCAAGLCCSADGICDDSKDSCSAPDCKFVYGPACDANALPGGASTSSVSRPHIGEIPYGIDILHCRVITRSFLFPSFLITTNNLTCRLLEPLPSHSMTVRIFTPMACLIC